MNYSEVKNTFIFITGRCKKLFRLINNLNSLLTRSNFDRIVRYVSLFGFKLTFNELNKKLWADNYYLYAGNKSPSITRTRSGSKDGSIPIHDSVISVVIPVKNAGNDLKSLLSIIRNQKGFKEIEIIVVDSGSTDGSIKIAIDSGAKIIRILPEEFSHCVSRNIGAKNATGDYVLFTVQDALPSSDSWLHNLFSVFLDNEVVAISCAEIPRDDADLFYKALSWSHNNFMEVEDQDRIMMKPDIENHLAYKKNSQLNNIACLISKDVFMKYEFRGNYAEDLDLGIRLIRDGYKLAMISSTKIIHSHNRPAYYYLKRGYIEHIYFSKLLPNFPIFAIDFEQLVSEIRQVYQILNSIVNTDLNEFNMPGPIKNISHLVMNRLYNIDKNGYPEIIDLDSNRYLDNKFVEFVHRLNNKTNYNQTRNLDSQGVLLDKMQSYTALILEYMDNSYNSIDQKLLEEFKQGLFKAYAFICGTQLASSYLTYSDDADHRYKEIDNELQQQT